MDVKENGINGNTVCQDGPGSVAVNGLEVKKDYLQLQLQQRYCLCVP